MAVDVHAGDGAEDHGRDQEAQDQQADRGARAGDGEHLDGQPVQHHVAADLGDDLREPQRQEAPVAQDGDGRLGGCGRRSCHSPLNEATEATLELASFEQHAPRAAVALESDVGAQPDYGPRVRSARMALGERQPIAEPQLERSFSGHSEGGSFRRAAAAWRGCAG